MRLSIAILAVALSACSSSPVPRGSGEDLTQGLEQCSKHGWGTPEMASCTDAARAAQRRAVAPAGPAEPAAAAPAETPAPAQRWPWSSWF